MNADKSTKSKEITERMQRIAIADSLIPSRLSLCLIAVLELYFLVTWLIFDRSFTDFYEYRYFICYILLLVFSVVAFILSFVFEKDQKNGYKKLTVLQAIAAVLILLWAVLVTIFDADHHTEFSYIIYATIVVILPAVIYVNRALLNFMYLLCDTVLIIFTVIIKPNNFFKHNAEFLGLRDCQPLRLQYLQKHQDCIDQTRDRIAGSGGKRPFDRHV